MKKRVVFGNYHYRECDNLALYLERWPGRLDLQRLASGNGV